MNKNIKIILLIANVLALLISILWFIRDKGFEPVIVFVLLLSSIVTVIFENKIEKISIRKVSDSGVDIESTGKESTDIEIENIKKGSKVKIRQKSK